MKKLNNALRAGDNPLEFPGLQFTRSPEDSKALNESEIPSIIISASGMCEVGRIKHHLKHNLWDKKNTVLFVGYQAVGTLGNSIVNGAKKVKIFGEEIVVNARIEYIESYSGHADQEGLMNFVYSFNNKKPKHIFLVHGEKEAQAVLCEKIRNEAKIDVTIPSYGQTYSLKDIPELVNSIAHNKSITVKTEIVQKLNKLQMEMDDMKMAIKEDLKSKDLKDEDIFRIKEKMKKLEQDILNIVEG